MLVPGTPTLAADAAAAAAERVGFVEEHDHAAVPDREPAQPHGTATSLSTPMPKNMLMNAPGSTKTYGLPVSPTIASAISVGPARRPPQQDAAGHVTAVVLDRLRVLEEKDVLLHTREHVILAPHVGELWWSRLRGSTSTPPLERNQKIATNWLTPSSMITSAYKMIGSER